MTTDLIAAIENAANLDGLHAALLAHKEALGALDPGGPEHAGLRDALHVDDLPTWGEEYESDLLDVWSWDKTRVLVSIADGWSVEARTDTIHSLPPRWSPDRTTDELRFVAGEGGGPIYATINRSDNNDDDGLYRWEYVVEIHGEEIARGEELTARAAAEAAEESIACHVLTADPYDVIRLLAGTQQQIADRAGFSQPTICAWLDPANGQGMARSSRHLVLALIGCTWGRTSSGLSWRFAG